VVVGGPPGPEYDEILVGVHIFSPDGKRVAYAASKGEKDLVVVDGKPGDKARRLHTLGASDGKVQWSWPVADGASGEFVLAGDRLFIAGSETGVACLARDSKDSAAVIWTYSRGACVGSPAESEGRVLLALTGPDRLVVLDSLGGAEVWTRPLAAKPTTGPVLVGETVCLGLESGVAAFALLDGRELWAQPAAGKVDVPLVAAGGRLACVSADSELSLLDTTSGAVVRACGSVSGRFPPLLTPEALFVSRARGLVRLGVDAQGANATWLRTARSDRILTPLVVANSHVYFGSTRGLVCARPAP
jgi:outer membrane protein assembly factor BamB